MKRKCEKIEIGGFESENKTLGVTSNGRFITTKSLLSFFSPYRYGKDLALRFANGENLPIAKRFKYDPETGEKNDWEQLKLAIERTKWNEL